MDLAELNRSESLRAAICGRDLEHLSPEPSWSLRSLQSTALKAFSILSSY